MARLLDQELSMYFEVNRQGNQETEVGNVSYI